MVCSKVMSVDELPAGLGQKLTRLEPVDHLGWDGLTTVAVSNGPADKFHKELNRVLASSKPQYLTIIHWQIFFVFEWVTTLWNTLIWPLGELLIFKCALTRNSKLSFGIWGFSTKVCERVVCPCLPCYKLDLKYVKSSWPLLHLN